MTAGSQLLARLFEKRIARETKRHLVTIAREQSRALRSRSSTFAGTTGRRTRTTRRYRRDAIR